MNARQKAKYYKKKYEELLNEPMKVIEKTRNLQPFKVKSALTDSHYESVVNLDPKIAYRVCREQAAEEVGNMIKESNITVRHSTQAGLHIFETVLYLDFEKEGMVDDLHS